MEYVVYWRRGGGSPYRQFVKASSKSDAYQRAIAPFKNNVPKPELIEVRTREEDSKLPQIR